MISIKRILAKSSAVGAIVAIGSLFVATSAFAAPGNSGSDKPGFGLGDKHHHHHGPPGHSHRPSDMPGDDDHVSASFTFTAMAEGSAHAVAFVLGSLLHSVHFG